MALGVSILANSRPYEGLLLCVPVAIALLWWASYETRPAASVLLRRAIAPGVLLLIVGGMMAYYNFRVFGNAFTLPYQVNRATYASAPVFIWQHPRPQPAYRYKVMRDFYSKWEMGDFLYARTLTGFLHGTAKKLGTVLFFFFGVALFPPLVMLPRVFLDRRVRFLLVTGGVFGVGLSLNAVAFPALPGSVYLRTLCHSICRRCATFALAPRRRPSGLALVRAIPVLCLVLAGLRLYAGPLESFHCSLAELCGMEQNR